MSEIPRIADDKRTILSVWGDGEGGWSFTVNRHGSITKIVVYEETGPGAMMPWLAVFEGDKLLARINAATCGGVTYK